MKYEIPTEVVTPAIGGGEDIQYTHDAFGMIGMSVVNHTGVTLFGSDLDHGQSIRITLKRAKLNRHNNNDWIHSESGIPIAEVTLSQHQFAEFITTPNRGDGIPCTINYASARGTPTAQMPGIINRLSKAEILRNEVKNSAKKELEKLREQLQVLRAAIDKPSMSKKELKEAMHDVTCTVGNLPANMEFVVEQAEEALDKAVTSAKIDVEAYITNSIHKLGVDAARSIGLTLDSSVRFLENNGE